MAPKTIHLVHPKKLGFECAFQADKAYEKPLFMVKELQKNYSRLIFADICIIGVQHLLPTTMRMFCSLFKQGLSPDRLFLIGKSYSTHPQVYQKMRKLGIHVDPASIEFKSHESFDHQFQRAVEDFIQKSLPIIYRHKPKKLIIIDDGGVLLTEIHKNSDLLSSISSVVGIEQTTSGFRALSRTKLKIPVINVARSRTKLTFESPLIAKTSVSAMFNHLTKLAISPHRTLIIGKGIIGKAIHRELRKFNFKNISFFDTKTTKTSISKNALNKKLHQFDLIIGCTGTTSLGANLHHLLKQGTTLVSVSSSDREFEANSLRRKIRITNDCHKDLVINKLHLLNSGFPINFDNSFNADSEEFQLTRSLLAQAMFQAVSLPTNARKKIYPINSSVQKSLVSLFKSLFLSKDRKSKNKSKANQIQINAKNERICRS